RRERRSSIATVARWTGAFLIAQVIVGALQVWMRFPAGLVALHISLAEAVWGGLVVITVLAYRQRQAMPGPHSGQQQELVLPDGNGEGEGQAEAKPRLVTVSSWRQAASDYVALTKPEIISLLLVTTICAMFIAGP